MGEFNNTIDLIGHDALVDGVICRTITELKDEHLTTIGSWGLASCPNLTKVDLKSVTIIDSAAFGYCSKLETIILRSETMPTLGGSWIVDTAFAKGTGYIYVPSAWIDKFKTHAYVSSYADRVRALEDYTVDGTIYGELDESKI